MVLRDDRTGNPLGVLVWAEITFSDHSGPKGKLYQASSEEVARNWIEDIFRIGPCFYGLKPLDWQCLPADTESHVIAIVSVPVTP
ncbi:MAG: hypothetical protein Q7S64_00615 [bacterium]|nr:hypothetical protein [bacterium]